MPYRADCRRGLKFHRNPKNEIFGFENFKKIEKNQKEVEKMAVGETETPIIGQATEQAYGFKSNKCKVRVPNMEDVYSKEETFGRMELRFIHSVYPYSSPSITIGYPEGMDASTAFVMSASAYTRVNDDDEVTLTPINISQITLKASGILINPASPANCIDLILAIRSAAPVVQ